MTQEYGSPNAGDATAATVDSRVNRMSREVMRRTMAGSRLLNRQPGSKVLTLPEQKEEYEAQYLGNPQAKFGLLQRLQAQLGPVDGTVEYIKWVKKHDPSFREKK